MPGAPPDAQKQLQWTEADLARVKVEFLGRFSGVEGESDLLAKAGNAQATSELFDLRIEMFKESRTDTSDKMYNHDLGRIYYFYANYTALTSGDREKAAQLWTESCRLWNRPLTGTGPTKQLPVWWPEGKIAVSKPPDKPKDTPKPAPPVVKPKDAAKDKAPPKPVPKPKAKGK